MRVIKHGMGLVSERWQRMKSSYSIVSGCNAIGLIKGRKRAETLCGKGWRKASKPQQ
jgi:hypothetical protein